MSTMTGCGTLFRLALRRDRWLLPIWIIGFALVAMFSASATRQLYPSVSSLSQAAATLNETGALVALYGRVYDATSLGAVSLIKMTGFGAALVALLMAFVVVRHTRNDEESGRLELVCASAVGRNAPLAAAMLTGFASSCVLGVATGAGLAVTGLPISGCLAFGLSWALTGIVFSAVAAIAAQVVTTGRAAIGVSAFAVGLAYVLRAVGDVASAGPGWLSWLSPIGWSQQLRPFAGDRWWVTVLPLGCCVVLVPIAFVLRSRRDLGAGLIADRPGPAHGSLRSVLALAVRLQRASFVAWVVGTVVMGLVLGSVVSSVTDLLSSAEMRQLIIALGGEQRLTDAFVAAELAMLGPVIAAYAVMAVARLHAEEAAGHAELLLSTATSRVRWAAGHVGVALGGSAVLLFATGTAIGIGYATDVGDWHQVGQIAIAGLAQIPAIWVVAACVVVLFGWIPRWVGAGWGLLVAFIVLGEFGALWKLPQWVLDLSPFSHSPQLPGTGAHTGAVVPLIVIALVGVVIGMIGWRRRDVI